MHISDVEPLLDVLSFNYVVPHTSAGLTEAASFQLFAAGLAETVWAFDCIAALPRDASELVQDSRLLVHSRIAGRGLRVHPIAVEDIGKLFMYMKKRLVVVLSSTDEVVDAVNAFLKVWPAPVLHVSYQDPPLSKAVLRQYCLKVASHWADLSDMRLFANSLRKSLKRWKDSVVVKELGFMDRNHLLTFPNMKVLESVGLKGMQWDNKPLVGQTNVPYFEALKESVLPICDMRKQAKQSNHSLEVRTKSDLILASPGAIKLLSQIPVRNDPQLGSVVEQRLFRSVLRQILLRETYAFQLSVSDSSLPVSEETFPDFVKHMFVAHTQDMRVCSAMLAVRAASSFCPVIRFPPSSNGAMEQLSKLADFFTRYRGSNHGKLNRLTNNLSDRLSKNVPDWIMSLIGESRKIKLVSDVPLEWMNVNGFPLMLRADISRIPTTPGNLCARQLVMSSEIKVDANAFQDVLIVRSFKENDPIRTYLEIAVAHYQQAGNFPKVRFVDVANKSDLVSALNSFSGAILVYDGHANHESGVDYGHLTLKEEQVDPLELKGIARVPPVVLLSACNTHPFDSSHMTVANAFLATGAITVLATSIPVQALHSAVMIARLLFRIGSYLPLLITERPWNSFRWSEILPGLQRRMYTTDVVRTLAKRGLLNLSNEDAKKIEFDVGMAIDTHEDWLSLLTQRIADSTLQSFPQSKEMLRRHVAFSDALSYVQLGNPELIVGVKVK